MSFDPPSYTDLDASGLRIAIVAACFNQSLVDGLIQSAQATLEAAGAPTPALDRVPGSAELPYATGILAASGDYDAVIALGVVIAGSTDHHAVIGQSTANALQEVSLRTGTPAINGIIVAATREQAEERTIGPIDRGREFAQAAMAMAQFKRRWTKNQTK